MDNNTKIKVDNLNLYIGKQHILKDINIEIPENKLTVILGPSGCGKTTLLKCMNRLTDLYPDVKINGSIFIDNEDILHTNTDVTEIRKKMGLLSQRPFPLPMNIYNNVAYGLKISGRRNKKALNARVENYLKIVSLWDEVKDRLHEPASKLSIGQQQRLCLARGLAVDPEIILADEPTANLDSKSATTLLEIMEKLNHEEKITFIFSTHDPRVVKMAHRVITLEDGKVISDDVRELPS